jgi:hypothetical protein
MKKFLALLSALCAAAVFPTAAANAGTPGSCSRAQAGLVRGGRACVRLDGRWTWRLLAQEATNETAPVVDPVTPTTAPPAPPPAPPTPAAPVSVVAVLPDPCKLLDPALASFGSAFGKEMFTQAGRTEATFRSCGFSSISAYLALTKDKSRSSYDDVEASRYLPNPDGSFTFKDGSSLRLFTTKKGVRIFFFSGSIDTKETLAAAQVLFNSVVAQI